MSFALLNTGNPAIEGADARDIRTSYSDANIDIIGGVVMATCGALGVPALNRQPRAGRDFDDWPFGRSEGEPPDEHFGCRRLRPGECGDLLAGAPAEPRSHELEPRDSVQCDRFARTGHGLGRAIVESDRHPDAHRRPWRTGGPPSLGSLLMAGCPGDRAHGAHRARERSSRTFSRTANRLPAA